MKNKNQSRGFLSLTFLNSALVFGGMIIIMFVLYLLLVRTNLVQISINTTKINLFIVLIIISAISGYAISFWLNRFMFHPVNKFINAMNQLSIGNYDIKLSFKSPVGQIFTSMGLTESFNKMTHELRHSEMLSRDFINNLSHEFKTPIVSIAGFAKLLKNGNLTEEEQKEYICIIEEESNRLATMASKLLNLMKVENQEILSNVTRFNISEQIRNSILLLESRWSKKDLDLHIDFDEYYIFGSEDLLKEVWINLLDNAIKYTPERGVIGVQIDQNADYIYVSIFNTGSEIPEKSKKLIFNKFYQVDESHSSEGYGIGLSLVKKIVSLHNGKIELESKDDVTTFTVFLPK